LSSLKERESKILRLYFGLDGADPMTLEDIGTRSRYARTGTADQEKALRSCDTIRPGRSLESFLG